MICYYHLLSSIAVIFCGGKRAIVAIAEYFLYLGWWKVVSLDFKPDLERRTYLFMFISKDLLGVLPQNYFLERITLFENRFQCLAEAANFLLDDMFLNRIILFPFVLRQLALCVLFLLLLILTCMLTDIQGLALPPSHNFKRMIIGVYWITAHTGWELRPLMVPFKFTCLSLMQTEPVLCLHSSWIHITCFMLQHLRSWCFMVGAIRQPMKQIPKETKNNPYWASWVPESNCPCDCRNVLAEAREHEFILV